MKPKLHMTYTDILSIVILCILAQGCTEDDAINRQETDAGAFDLVEPGMDMSVEDLAPQEDMNDTAPDMEDMGPPDEPPEPVESEACVTTTRRVTCEYVTTELDVDGTTRDIHWQVPSGTPPPEGWPVVFFFQGSLFSSQLSWDNTEDAPYGADHLTETFKALLDEGYAVLAPEASLGGSTFWDTNIWPYSNNWEISNDHELMLTMFSEIELGTFGVLDPESLFATGISSGGYMTSRMAIAYPGKFKALAVASASYATCGGIVCAVPDAEDLPADHPPTLFVHGDRDLTVPISTMKRYAERLEERGIDTVKIVDDSAGHEWLELSVENIPVWFNTYR